LNLHKKTKLTKLKHGLTLFYNTYNTRLMALCPRLPRWASTRKVKPIKMYWSKRQWVIVASAGHESLHLTSDR